MCSVVNHANLAWHPKQRHLPLIEVRSGGLSSACTCVLLCVCDRGNALTRPSVYSLHTCVFECMPAGTWVDTLLWELVMAVFPSEPVLCGWWRKGSGWPCFPRAMALVPYTVARLASTFAIIILVRICLRSMQKLKPQGQTTYYTLKWYKLSYTWSLCIEMDLRRNTVLFSVEFSLLNKHYWHV